MKTKKTLLTLGISAAIAFCVHAENAEQHIEKVTVYGALTETPLSEMAASVSVLSTNEIDQRQAQHLETLFNKVSNLNFATGASRGRFVQIRGIGERSQFVDPVNPSVGFLVDGIDYSGLLAGASTFDVQQIEVFKGPNSARFGAEGLAGMINVLTAEPTAETRLQAGIANYGSWHLGAALGAEVNEQLAYRVSLHKNQSDGFINNIHLDREDTQNIDEITARAKLVLQVSDNLSVSTIYHGIDVDNGYDAFSLDQNRNTLSDEPGFDRQDSHAFALKADYQGLAWASLKTKLTYLTADLDYGYDEDWSFVGIAPGWEYSSTDHYLRDRDDKSIEITLTEKAQQRWLVGVYYADEQEDLLRNFFDFDLWVDASFTSELQRTDTALFGQIQHYFDDSSWLTASLRLAQQELDYVDANQIQEALSDTDWGAELSYHHKVNEQAMLYTSVSRSYKMGGVNGVALANIDEPGLANFRQLLLDNRTFAPESLLGTEFGIKAGSADGDLSLDLAAFYQWREDVQFRSWFVSGQEFTGLFDNAADGTNYGLEVSLNYWVNDHLRLFGNLGWLKTELNDFTRVVDDVVEVVAEREQAHAPEYQVNLGAELQLIEDLRWTLEVDAKDEYFYSFSHDQVSDSLVLVHTSLLWQIDNWQLTLFARNLFDEEYGSRGFFFGNDPRPGVRYEARLYEQLGEPRRFGATVSYQF